jgi:hypothetical protein
MAKKKELTAKQHKAIAALSVGKSQADASKLAQVRAATMREWMKDDGFREELRQTMERMRGQFESRIMQVANNAAVVVQQMLVDPSMDVRAKGATLALNAAVRLSTRYKELQMEGYVPPPRPFIIFPEGTQQPWMAKALPEPPEPPKDMVIDAEAIEVDKG